MNGTEIRQRREALHLSQRELADRAGISDETLRKIEHERPVGGASLRKVVAALDAASPASGGAPTVGVADRRLSTGQGVVTIKVAALGLEVETTFDGTEDRARAIAELMQSIGLQGEVGSEQGDSPGGASVPRRP